MLGVRLPVRTGVNSILTNLSYLLSNSTSIYEMTQLCTSYIFLFFPNLLSLSRQLLKYLTVSDLYIIDVYFS